MKYEGIGFNAEHLSKMNRDQFVKEVSRQLNGDKDKIAELYSLIKAKYPKPRKANEYN